MTDPGPEDAFETFLKRRTVLPDAWSGYEKLEPPAALDEIVLKQAREAVDAPRRPDRAPRWALPVALAATILLCLSVVLNVSLNTHRPKDELDGMTGTPTDKEPPAATDAEWAQAQAPASTDAITTAPEGARNAAAASSAPAARATASAPTSAATASTTAPPPAAPTAPGDALSEPPTGTARERPVEARERDQPALAKRAAEAKAAAPARQDPKEWLRQIDALRAQGKTVQADAEMRRFRAAFPAYPAEPGQPASSEPLK